MNIDLRKKAKNFELINNEIYQKNYGKCEKAQRY